MRTSGSRASRMAAASLLEAVTRDEASLNRARAADLLARTETGVLLQLAAYHRVGGLLYEALRSFLGPAHPVMASLADGYGAAVRGHLRVMWELARVIDALEPTGVRWAVVKGPVLVEALYGAPGRRVYGDLDLLVEPGRIREVIAALEGTGATLLDRNWTALRRDLRGELHLGRAGGIAIDLHWNVINMYRRRMWIDTGELLDRAVRIDLGGLEVPTLDETDTLLHLAVHAGLSGGDRLVWLKDLERATVHRAPDWQEVVDRARRWRVGGPVALMLSRAAEVLGAPVPREVPLRLLRPGSTQLIRLVDRLSPWELSCGRLTALNLVMARSMAHGVRGGAAWLVERAFRNLDPREPAASHALTPSGTMADREAYLDMVTALGARSYKPSMRGAAPRDA